MTKIEISKEQCLRLAKAEGDSEVGAGALAMDPTLCGDCPPSDYPTDETRCAPCPRRRVAVTQDKRHD
jgi:hypothetical protein